MRPGFQRLRADRFVQGINIRFHGIGAVRRIAVSQGIGILRLVACTGTYQPYKCMLEGGIIVQKRFIPRLVLLYDKLSVLREHVVQKRLFLLNLLNQENHGVIIRSHDMAQGHLVYVHGCLAYFSQPFFAFHIVVRDVGGACVYITDINNRKNV